MLRYLLDGFLLAFLFWFALTGLRNGLIGMLGRLLASLAALVAAYLFIGPVTAFLETVPLYLSLHGGLSGSILKLFTRTAQTLPQAVAASGLPPALQTSLIARAGSGTGSAIGTPAGQTAGSAGSPFALLASDLARQALTALVFLVLFALVLLLIRLVLQMFSSLVNSLPVLGPLNRFAGLFAGIAYALLIVSVSLLLVTLAAPWLPRVAQSVGDTTLLAFIYRNNPLLAIF